LQSPSFGVMIRRGRFRMIKTCFLMSEYKGITIYI